MSESEDSNDYIPEEERVELYNEIGDLISNLEYIPADVIYNSKWPWSTCSLDDLSDQLIKMFINYPSSRPAVLESIGTLIHKDFYLFCEGPRHIYGERHYGLHLVVTKLIKLIEEYIDEKAGLLEIIQWSSKIILDLIHYNFKRIKISKQSPEVFLNKSETARSVLELVSKGIKTSLENDGYSAFKSFLWLYSELAVDEVKLDWFFAYLTKDFTVSAVKMLLKFGGNALRKSVLMFKNIPDGSKNIETNFMQEYYFLPRFFEFVSKTHDIEMTTAISNLFEEYYNGKLKDIFDIIFLIISLNFRLGLIPYILNIIMPLLTRQRILKMLQIIIDPNFIICKPLLKRPEEQTFLDFVYQTLSFFKPQKAGILLELLQPIAFDNNILENTSEFDVEQQNMLRNCLKQGCNELLNCILRAIHGTEKIELLELEPYTDLKTDDNLLKNYIQSCVTVSELNKERLKVLHGICYWSNNTFVNKIISLMLLSINTLDELKQFVIFSSTIITQYRYSMLDGFKDIIKNKNYYEELFNKNKLEFNIIKNFGLLLRWSELSSDDNYISFFNLKSNAFLPQGSIMELSGTILKFSSGLLLQHLEDIDEFDQETFKKICLTVDLFKAIDGIAPMEPSAAHSVCRILSTVYVHCLRLVQNDESDLASMSIFKMNEAIRHLLTQEKFQFPKEAWASSLVREVLLSSKEIFNFGSDLTMMKDGYSDKKIDASLYPPNFKLYEPEFRIMDDYRNKPAHGLDQVRTLAQTGSLPKSWHRDDGNKTNVTTSELLRKNIFIYTIDCLLTTPSSNPNSPDIIYDGSTLKEVAFTVVDIICGTKDLTSFISWIEWTDEKYLTKEFVTINNNIESTYPAYDLMQILVAGPNPTFYCLTPLFKAMLGYLINYCEVSPIKDSRVPEHILYKIEKLFNLLILARIEKETILLCYEVLVRCSIHEAGAILTKIWKVLTIIKPLDEDLTKMMLEVNINENGMNDIITENRDRILITLLNTVQRNLKTMADIGPKIIDSLSPEPADDIWANELYPVGSVTGDIKRQ